MNDNLRSVRGYRVLGDRPKDRELAMGYIHQSAESASLHTPLTILAAEKGANCIGREAEFGVGPENGGDDLPTDREAQMLCSTCPIRKECAEYAERSHPSWGVLGGKVYGRKLAADIEDAIKRGGGE